MKIGGSNIYMYTVDTFKKEKKKVTFFSIISRAYAKSKERERERQRERERSCSPLSIIP
jgi:hypothetical protein